MSYITLYRQWRPRHFSDIVEQEHVVKTLRYSVSTGRIAHAYLFCGTRGTGKTTMAQILSRAINCLNPKDGDPCNECEVCREILSGSCVDVLEIDAASNNSVDNVRQIRDEVIYAPTIAKRKVYIIDEVHMLSSGAFNALLKTLEEPPEHVVFILATTEPHKLPATILSRCQRFDFRRISQESIVEHLRKIAEAGGKELDLEAAKLIARLSDGAMRDAISLLDQCISLGSGTIRYENVLSVVGIVNDSFMMEFTESILEKRVAPILENISRLLMDGRDIANFVSDLVLYFRNLLICKVTNGQCGGLVDVQAEVLEVMRRQAESLSQDAITVYIKELSAMESALRYANSQRVLLEVTLIKLCGNPGQATANLGQSGSSLLDRIAALEKRLDSGDFTMKRSGAAAAGEAGAAGTAGAASGASAVSVGDVAKTAVAANQLFRPWQEVMDYLKDIGRRSIHTYLLNAKAVTLDEHHIALLFPAREAFAKAAVSKLEHLELIEDTIQKVCGRSVKVKCLEEDALDKTPAAPKAAEKDPLMEKARSIAEKAGLPLEILDE